MEPVEIPQEQSEERLEGVAIAEKPQRDWLKIILFSLLGLFILSGAIFAGYWYATQQVQQPEEPASVVSQPTPTPKVTTEPVKGPTVKAGWKLYRDEKVGYSLQYPDSWFLNDEVVELGGGEPLARKTTQILWITTHRDIPSHQAGDLGVGDNVRLGVNYIENKEGIGLREEMRKHVRSDFADNPPENITSSWITLSGLEAHRYIYYPGNKWGSPGIYTTIQLENGDFIRIVAIILHEFDSYLDQVIEVEDSFSTL